MRVIPYARVSSRHLQQDGFSIETQLDQMRAVCKAQGWTIVAEYVEYESAYEENLSRSELNKLLEKLRANGAEIVLYFSSDRFTRDVADGVVLRRELYRLGVRLFFCYPSLQEVRSENELVNILTDWQSQQYVEKLREASMRGYKAKIEGGAYGQGTAPYGYHIEGERRNSHLVVDEEEARIIRWIFDTYVYSGQTTTSIARALTEMGTPSPGEVLGRSRKRAVGIWSQFTLYKILRQEAYAGTWYGLRYEKKGGKKQFRQRPRDEWIAVTVEPIISRELWQEAQAKLDAKAFKRNQKHQYLMARRLTCGCGYAIRATTNHVNTSRERRYYRCVAYRNTNGQCGLPGFQAELIEDAVWGWVEQLLKNPTALLEGYRQAQQALDEQHHHTKRQITLLDEQIHDYTAKLERLVDLYLDGGYPKDVLDVRKNEYVEITERLSRQREVLARQLEQALITDNDIASIEAFAQKARERLDGMDEFDYTTKRNLIEALNVRGTLKVEDTTKVLYLHWFMHTIRLPLEISGNDGGTETGASKRGSVSTTAHTR